MYANLNISKLSDYVPCNFLSNTNGGSNSIKSGAMSSKKTNSFRGVSSNTGNIMEGDQPNPNSFLSPYEQLEAESEALVSKLLDVVSKLRK